MTSRIEHRAEFTNTAADVLTAISDEKVLRARLEELGGKNAALISHEPTEDGVRYVLRQGIDINRLPPAVRSIRKEDLMVRREQTWRRATDSDAATAAYTGTAKAVVKDVPGEITVRTELIEKDGQTVVRTSGEVKVNIPFLGGMLENVIAEQIGKLLDRETEFTAKWLITHNS